MISYNVFFLNYLNLHYMHYELLYFINDYVNNAINVHTNPFQFGTYIYQFGSNMMSAIYSVILIIVTTAHLGIGIGNILKVTSTWKHFWPWN